MAHSLVTNEIYLSLQGESTFAGLPCIFVRLTACNLRCSYCDTAYAFMEGERRTFASVKSEVDRLARPWNHGDRFQILGGHSGVPRLRLPLIEFTGGEPLLQPSAAELMRQFCDEEFTVLVETNGAQKIANLDPRIRRIMDLKCPSSGEVDRNLWDNVADLRATDEVKFVIGTVEDYQWARQIISEYRLTECCPILFSWVAPLRPDQKDPSLKPVPAGHTPLTLAQLAEKIVLDGLPVRFQLQMHKYIWAPNARGV